MRGVACAGERAHAAEATVAAIVLVILVVRFLFLFLPFLPPFLVGLPFASAVRAELARGPAEPTARNRRDRREKGGEKRGKREDEGGDRRGDCINRGFGAADAETPPVRAGFRAV